MKWSILFCAAFFLAGCSSHVISHRQEVSRDFTYIDFAADSEPYTIESFVGGEHMSFTKVLGFAGEIYSVELLAGDEEVMVGVSGEGVSVYGDESAEHQRDYVIVEEMDAIFTVDVSAHPQGEYFLKISKLNSDKGIPAMDKGKHGADRSGEDLDDLQQKATEVHDLLGSMVMELRFRGCEDSHKLIRQAEQLRRWFHDRGMHY